MIERDQPTAIEFVAELAPVPADDSGNAPIAELVDQIVDRYSEVARAQSRLRTLLAASRAVVDELSLPSLYRRIAAVAGQLLSASHAALAVLGPDGSVVQLVQWEADAEEASTVPVAVEGLAALTELAAHLAPRQVSRTAAREHVELPSPWRDGFVATPVHYRNTLLALLLVAESADGHSSEDDEALLGLAVTAGIAVENARLYEESRQRQEWLREAAEVSAQLLTSASELEALELVVDSVQRLADADLVALLVPGSPGLLRVARAVGHGADELVGCQVPGQDRLVAHPLPHSSDLPARTGEDKDQRLVALTQSLGIGPAMVFPLGGKKGTRAVLLAGRREDRPDFAAVDLDMAASFASQAAMAMEVVATYAVEQRLSKLEDRERIARDLHDHVIQRLFAAGLKLQSATSLAQEDALLTRLTDVVGEIDSTIQQLRLSIFQLNSADQDQASLRTSVLEVIEQVVPVLGFRPAVRFNGPVDSVSEPAVVEEVVAVVREAATNAGKHAQATLLGVELVAAHGTLAVTVTDDGVGIGPTSRRSGLDNMRQRAERLGGSLDLDSTPGKGTTLRWSVPTRC